MKSALNISLLVVTVLMLSCNSPVELDTPVKRTPVSGPKVTMAIREIVIEANGAERYFDPLTAFIYLDTIVKPNALWLDLKMENAGSIDNSSHINIRSIELHADSISVTNTPFRFDKEQARAIYTLQGGFSENKSLAFDTVLVSGESRNCSELTMGQNVITREIKLDLYSKLYFYHNVSVIKDTVIAGVSTEIEFIDRKQDSIIIKAALMLGQK